MKADKEFCFLRRTVRPYVGQSAIMLIVTIWLLFVSAKTGDWGFMLGLAVALVPFLYLVSVGLKYKIYWTSQEVCQKASGGASVRIKISAIANVVAERSRPAEMLSMSRPYRRITIYEVGSDKSKFIDISLRHFNLGDIRDLLQSIRKQRPELTIPNEL